MRLVAFDLDGTLCESKGPIQREVGLALLGLYERGVSLAVISGCSRRQMFEQAVPMLPDETYLLPTCGGQILQLGGGVLHTIETDPMAPSDRMRAVAALADAASAFSLRALDPMDRLIEDREFQVTLSCLGQRASQESKVTWAHASPLHEITRFVQGILPDLSVRSGGLTSVDVLPAGRDKGQAMARLCAIAGVSERHAVFVGDRLDAGGNDEPVLHTGAACLRTSGPSETLRIIHALSNVAR